MARVFAGERPMNVVNPEVYAPDTAAGRSEGGRRRIMHLGVFSYNVDYGARPDELARAAEDRGFESFWVGEHTHIPGGRQTPYPGGDPLPKPYYHMADPFVSLMAAASATSRIKLGTAVCLVVEHDPIVLAKTVGDARLAVERPRDLRHRRRVEP